MGIVAASDSLAATTLGGDASCSSLTSRKYGFPGRRLEDFNGGEVGGMLSQDRLVLVLTLSNGRVFGLIAIEVFGLEFEDQKQERNLQHREHPS
jgi:hypothetical protein